MVSGVRAFWGSAALAIAVLVGFAAPARADLALQFLSETITACGDPNNPGGRWVNPQNLTVAGGQPTSGYTWTVTSGSSLPSGLALDNLTGVIHASNPNSLPAPGQYDIPITVTDQIQSKSTSFGTFLLDTTQCSGRPVFQVLAGRIPLDAQVNVPYGATLSVVGGVPPYSWHLASGSSLPPGMTLDASTGVIHGTPSQTGTYTFSIVVNDSTGDTAIETNSYTLVVGTNQQCNLVVTPATDTTITGSQGGPFSPNAFVYNVSTSSGTANYTITGIPSWITPSATSGTATTTATPINFTVNANANSLTPATYSAAINVGTSACGAQRNVTLTVANTTPSLQVSPSTNVSTSGPQGGPFSPASFSYTISSSVGTLNYSISGPGWLTASSTSGSVGTAGTTISFTVNASANNITQGSYTGQIVFTNTTNNLGTQSRTATITVNAPPSLLVSPSTNSSTTGTQGGPFSPSSFSYTLSASAGTVNYSISGVPSWLTPSATSGSVGTSGTTITFTVNSTANSISPGTFTGQIVFTNTTNNLGSTTRNATITVNAPPALVVSPSTAISASGPNGGPFSPSSFTYKVSASSGTIGFSISGVPSWLTPSATSGTVNTTGTNVTFTVNANANSLAVANYSATISFTNTTNGQGNQTRSASLSVQAPALVVSPATNMQTAGANGGPFTPSSFTYTLSASIGSLNYSITGLPNWLTPSATSGTVTTAGTPITFTVNANANSLALGTTSATVSFTNTTNGQGNQSRTASVIVQAGLIVTPSSDMNSNGPQGGPFSPNQFSYTLKSTSGSIAYSITGVPNWMTASSTSGTVDTNGSAVTFSINSKASSLAAGVYSPQIGFVNATNGQGGQTRNAVLTIAHVTNFTQQGPKLAGSDSVNDAGQGSAVGISKDGNTAIVGGQYDGGCNPTPCGAAWIYTRSSGNWTQQGPKLVGSGAVGTAYQGYSVAISGDGNTALVGGYADNSNNGAVWVFTRSNGTWSPQGSKLLPNDKTGTPDFGDSVALSDDGNTAAIGGTLDNGGIGAAWVFTRSNGAWTQQGSKLIASGASGSAGQGRAVALSADGNTLAVGGPNDNANAGAAWIFTRTGNAWSQQGGKLVATGQSGASLQGYSLSIAADGNTLISGGPNDNSTAGAAWIFTRSAGAWTQQGSKLVGSGAVGFFAAQQGTSVAISGDGNTAFIGGPYDNSANDSTAPGAVWIFTRSNGAWSQKGTKLLATGATGKPLLGWSMDVSTDGTTLIAGGPGENKIFSADLFGIGGAWIFDLPALTPSRTGTHDFNADGMSDLLWRSSTGDVSMWLVNGTTVSQKAGQGNVPTAWTVVGQRDFDGDGKSDILWRNTGGDVTMWFMNGVQIVSGASVGSVPTDWSVVGLGDFNGDGNGDILWRNSNGDLAIWTMKANSILSGIGLGNVPTAWSVIGTGDFNGDGTTDILWRNSSGDVTIWFISNGQIVSSANIGNVPSVWSVGGVADFDGDGKSDIFWRNTAGDVAIWLMNGGTIVTGAGLGNVPTAWSVGVTGDFNGDGKADIAWRNAGGDTVVWYMNGASVASGTNIGNQPTIWTLQGLNAN